MSGRSSVDRVEPVLNVNKPQEHHWESLLPSSTEDLAPHLGQLHFQMTAQGHGQARKDNLQNVNLPCMVIDQVEAPINCAKLYNGLYQSATTSHGRGTASTQSASSTQGVLDGAWQVANRSSLPSVLEEELSCVLVEADQLTTAFGQTYTMVAHHQPGTMVVRDALLKKSADGILQMTCKFGQRAFFERVEVPDPLVLSDLQGKWACREGQILTIEKAWWHFAKKHRTLHGFLHIHKATGSLMLRDRTLQTTSSGDLVLEDQRGRILQFSRHDEPFGLVAITE